MKLLKKIWSILTQRYSKGGPTGVINNFPSGPVFTGGSNSKITSLGAEFFHNVIILILCCGVMYIAQLLGALDGSLSILFIPIIFFGIKSAFLIMILPFRVVYRLFNS